jgi:hypothetical protein
MSCETVFSLLIAWFGPKFFVLLLPVGRYFYSDDFTVIYIFDSPADFWRYDLFARSFTLFVSASEQMFLWLVHENQFHLFILHGSAAGVPLSVNMWKVTWIKICQEPRKKIAKETFLTAVIGWTVPCEINFCGFSELICLNCPCQISNCYVYRI